MEKTVKLKDKREVVVRDMRPEDAEKSRQFFLGLSEEDRKYLRRDLTRPGVIEERMRDVASGRVCRLVALDAGKIVSEGSLELWGHGWGDSVGEVRLIVATAYQRSGLGSLLMRELYLMAAGHKMDRIVARFARPQEGARQILKRLGFRDEFFIPEQMKDRDGCWQDLIIMRCNLNDLWAEMEASFEHPDGRYPC